MFDLNAKEREGWDKLGVSFWDYLGSRLDIPGAPPILPLPDLIRARRRPPGLSPGFAPVTKSSGNILNYNQKQTRLT